MNKIDYSESVHARHGGAYDRGSADSYYGRPCEPHYFTGATHSSTKIEKEDMSEEEIAAYYQGYDDNERMNIRKEW